MEPILQELSITMPDPRELARVVLRLLAALAVGTLIGYEREKMGKAAGLRTHMLVSMGTALFVIAAIEAGMDQDAVSRIIQGIVTGVGFLGAGVIMKNTESGQIRGLTTAAGVWMTAAASVAIGLGEIGLGLLAGGLAWVVLAIMHRFEPEPRPDIGQDDDPP